MNGGTHDQFSGYANGFLGVVNQCLYHGIDHVEAGRPTVEIEICLYLKAP